MSRNKARRSPILSFILIQPPFATCLNCDDTNIPSIGTLPVRDVGGNFDIPC